MVRLCRAQLSHARAHETSNTESTVGPPITPQQCAHPTSGVPARLREPRRFVFCSSFVAAAGEKRAGSRELDTRLEENQRACRDRAFPLRLLSVPTRSTWPKHHHQRGSRARRRSRRNPRNSKWQLLRSSASPWCALVQDASFQWPRHSPPAFPRPCASLPHHAHFAQNNIKVLRLVEDMIKDESLPPGWQASWDGSRWCAPCARAYPHTQTHLWKAQGAAARTCAHAGCTCSSGPTAAWWSASATTPSSTTTAAPCSWTRCGAPFLGTQCLQRACVCPGGLGGRAQTMDGHQTHLHQEARPASTSPRSSSPAPQRATRMRRAGTASCSRTSSAGRRRWARCRRTAGGWASSPTSTATCRSVR